MGGGETWQPWRYTLHINATRGGFGFEVWHDDPIDAFLPNVPRIGENVLFRVDGPGNDIELMVQDVTYDPPRRLVSLWVVDSECETYRKSTDIRACEVRSVLEAGDWRSLKPGWEAHGLV